MFLLIALCFMCLCILLNHYWTKRHLYLLALRLPGPPALPILGNALTFFCKREDRLNAILKLTVAYPSPLRIWLGPKLIVFIKDPDHLQTVLTSTKMATKDSLYRFLEPFLGRGLFTSSGPHHRSHRKMLQPLFSPKVLEGYSHMFQKHATILVETLRKNVNGPAFDVLLYLHDSAFVSTMDILVEDRNDHSVDYKDIPEFIRRFYDLFINRVTTFWLHPDWVYQKTKQYREQEEMKKIAVTMTKEIAQKRVPDILTRLEKKKLELIPECNNNSEQRFSSMLEMMIEMAINNPNSLSEADIIDHMMTFVATSQDTQSSAIAFTLWMLGMHPNIQEKVFEELKEVVGEIPNAIDYSHLGKLKYMEMCIKEAMRLFAVGPFILRVTEEDFQIDKWKIPAGCTVIIGIYNVHRDPRHWERPEEFYPEHFLSDAVLNRHPYAYVPFSAGPRRCIAQQYSYVNMKIIIGNILQHFYIEADGKLSDIKLMTDISIRPVNGHMIRLKERVVG